MSGQRSLRHWCFLVCLSFLHDQRASAVPRLVLDVMPGTGSGLLAPRSLLPVGNYLLFTAHTFESGAEPWRDRRDGSRHAPGP